MVKDVDRGHADHLSAQPPWPSVGVVIATHNRPELMRRALRSVLEQEYRGTIEVVLVFDRTEPETELESSAAGRVVRVMNNVRSPGLAGARNSGILSLNTDLVAFCDDDDRWLQSKLERQVQRLSESPGSVFCTTAMRVEWATTGELTDRRAYRSQVHADDLIRSRMAALHPSSFLIRRAALVDDVGLVDERIPGSMAEDWDLMLRATRHRPIEHIDTPLVLITWGASSYFNLAWKDKNAAHQWLMDHHPGFAADSDATAMMESKLAFGHAALGERAEARHHLRRAMRLNCRQPRNYLAALVLAGVPAKVIQESLNVRGKGV